MMEATWGFKSRGISSLLPLKPTAATTCMNHKIQLMGRFLRRRVAGILNKLIRQRMNKKMKKTKLNDMPISQCHGECQTNTAKLKFERKEASLHEVPQLGLLNSQSFIDIIDLENRKGKAIFIIFYTLIIIII